MTPKPQTIAPLASGPNFAALAVLVDELGELQKDLAPFIAKFARVVAIQKALREAFRNDAQDRSIVIAGQSWRAHLSACGNQSKISVRALYKAIGIRQLLSIASVTLTAAAATVSPEVLATCTETTQTGPRKLTVVPHGEDQ